MPTIPPQLLTKILHEFLEDDTMRISNAANAAVGEYIKTFVREAIWRADAAMKEGREGEMGIGGSDEFLEVSLAHCCTGTV
jgi:centromere protein X